MSEWELAKDKTAKKVAIHGMVNFEKGEKPKISVIVPVYNNMQYLHECLDSIINQSLKEIEIICVNDGSTDESLQILLKYAEKDERVKVIDKENAGYGHSMNIGTDMASGDYIGIVESDDYIEHNMYETLYDAAVKNEADVVKSNFNRFVGTPDQRKFFFNKIAYKDSNYGTLIDPSTRPDVFDFVMNTWSGIYRREFLMKNMIRYNESPGASFQDNGFFFQTTMYTHRFYLVNQTFYNNRRDNENSSVMSTGKINCMKEEYDRIDRIIKERPDLYKNYIGISLHKRFQNYRFTYERIAEEKKLDYIIEVSKEYSRYSENELDKTLFSKVELEHLKFILDDPIGYHQSMYSSDVSISVITPAYNEEKNIEQCIDSVISQKLKNIELLIIDDGSTDKTVSIIKSYQTKYTNIKLLQQNHKGAGPARNMGIEQASGKYLAFMDADDLYPDNSVLLNLFTIAINNKAQICGGSFSRLQDGKVITKFEKELDGYTFKGSGFVDYKDYQFDYGYHRFIYSTSMIKDNNIRFPEYWRYQDPVFMVEAMICAKKFYTVPIVTYRYRKTTDKLAWNATKVIDLLKGIDDVLIYAEKNHLPILMHNNVMRINKDYLKIIMDQLDEQNVDVLLILVKIQNDIDIKLINEYKKFKEPFIIKPLYRLLTKPKIEPKQDTIQQNQTIEEIKITLNDINAKIDDKKKPLWKKLIKK